MGGRGASSAIASGAMENTSKQTSHYPDNFRNSTSEGEKFIQQTLGVDQSKAYDFWNAAMNYTGSWYSAVREHQQGLNDGKTAKKIADDLEEFISRSPKWDGGTTYRGLENLSPQTVQALTTKGAVVDMKGISSWSTEKGRAESFAGHGKGSVLFSVDGQSKGTSTRHLSSFPSENEVTVSQRARYEVVSSKYNSKRGYYEVKLKEI